MIIGRVHSVLSDGVMITPRLYAFFHKNKNFYFGDVPKAATSMLCTYISLSEYYENWEKLISAKSDQKFLLPTNWELIHSLLVEFKEQGKSIEVPEKNPPFLESGYFQNWKLKLKQSLLSLLESDYQNLVNKYISQVFNHEYSKLNYKLIHPEEIRNKYKLYPTLSGARNLYAFLNRKLEILPLFSEKKDSNLEIYSGWPLDKLENQTKHIYSSEWISKLESNYSDLFKLSSFKKPKLPNLQENSVNKQ